jgi:hypothetical protein
MLITESKAVSSTMKSMTRHNDAPAKILKSMKYKMPGFRMPAEWEPHQATWIGWPHNRTDWPGKFNAIPWVYGEIVRKLTQGETGSYHRRVRGS